jgi:hypothetical protein
MVAVTEGLELTCNDLVFSKPSGGERGSECLRSPGRLKRRWNKEEEEALRGPKEEDEEDAESTLIISAELLNNERGKHCQKIS